MTELIPGYCFKDSAMIDGIDDGVLPALDDADNNENIINGFQTICLFVGLKMSECVNE